MCSGSVNRTAERVEVAECFPRPRARSLFPLPHSLARVCKRPLERISYATFTDIRVCRAPSRLPRGSRRTRLFKSSTSRSTSSVTR
eukprot:524226-Pleurochrysis_carterae.AAC.1